MATEKKDNWSTEAYQNAASFVPKLATKVMQWLDPQSDDVILDIGCGDGVLDIEIAQILVKGTTGRLHGVDSSKAMIQAAEQKVAAALGAGGKANKCTFEVMDATSLIHTPSLQSGNFTKLFSNAALHWVLGGDCPDQKREDFFLGARNALTPGGIFAFEMGGLGNVSELRTAILMSVGRRLGSIEKAQELDPWFFPDEEWVTHIMEEVVGGWKVERVERQWRPTDADEGGVEGWMRLMAAQFFEVLEEKEREDCIREICDVLEVVCKKPGGGYMFSYVRLRVLARKV
ncbi:S-adenosyl-L-methionine-dependent methyltransferase [Apodospora peruviana]|uniref:S-adenosyl-L-methionine-dependent methyltransferase n=1 Tax=Apodospora peruviana TaxID=516989 RepID=A0AAE0IPS2_9PEZI|nr:S-adenosyl-L-methionine-dependent methyltransferase [Apodospora peruviana]